MSDYGVTEKGFVIKRLDTIIEEVHADLTKGFGFDTRIIGTSFLNCLVTTFSDKIADLWEVGQDSYYAKYPSTAIGVNLDNSVQYGCVRRKPNKRSVYQLHLTGDDGTKIPLNSIVSTSTKPVVRLYSSSEAVFKAFSKEILSGFSSLGFSIYTFFDNLIAYFDIPHYCSNLKD